MSTDRSEARHRRPRGPSADGITVGTLLLALDVLGVGAVAALLVFGQGAPAAVQATPVTVPDTAPPDA
ncbi:hypothetical protein [Streptomyces sp. NPDC050485]|uniref:hypothetical protein n=1 Tax=Streptomyces sp. NPDC050485 TaxID=3365617 RepID=UPI00379D5451